MSYVQLLETFQGQSSEFTKQIEKDLKRTFPDNEIFESDEGISALRRVLVAYSWLNPEIGYCQSMNFIAALFLLFMDEEDAFWLMRTTMEEILPMDYYTPGMQGVRADERLFLEMLSHKLPKVYAHLQKYEIDLSGFLVAWFISVYINVLPLEATLRIFDLLFCDGSTVLFRVGMALFKTNEKNILKEKSYEGLYIFLRTLATNVENSGKLIEVAYSSNILGSYSKEKIIEARNQHWERACRERIEETGRRGQTLHFEIEGADIKQIGIEDNSPVQRFKQNTWNMITPDDTRKPKAALLGSPRTIQNRRDRGTSETNLSQPISPVLVRQTRSEPSQAYKEKILDSTPTDAPSVEEASSPPNEPSDNPSQSSSEIEEDPNEDIPTEDIKPIPQQPRKSRGRVLQRSQPVTRVPRSRGSGIRANPQYRGGIPVRGGNPRGLVRGGISHRGPPPNRRGRGNSGRPQISPSICRLKSDPNIPQNLSPQPPVNRTVTRTPSNPLPSCNGRGLSRGSNQGRQRTPMYMPETSASVNSPHSSPKPHLVKFQMTNGMNMIDSRFENRFRPLSIFFNDCTLQEISQQITVTTRKAADHVVIDDEQAQDPPTYSTQDDLSNQNTSSLPSKRISAKLYDHVVVEDE